MDVQFINPFITSTRNLFDTMIRVPLSLGKPSVRSLDVRLDRLSDMATVVELSGGVSGLVVVHFTKMAACLLVSKLTGETVRELDADALDALGEIGNMIVGGAKKDLPCELVTISTPRVVKCDKIEYPQVGPILLVPFSTPLGTTPVLEVTFKRNGSAEKQAETPVAKAA